MTTTVVAAEKPDLLAPRSLLILATLFSTVAALMLGYLMALVMAWAMMSVVVIPAWLWGPALALAVWGYVAQRRRLDLEDHEPTAHSTDDARISRAS